MRNIEFGFKIFLILFLYLLNPFLVFGKEKPALSRSSSLLVPPPHFGKPGPIFAQPLIVLSEEVSFQKETKWLAGWTKDSKKLFYCIALGACTYQKTDSSKEIILENPEDREDELLDIRTGEIIPPLSLAKQQALQKEREHLIESLAISKNQTGDKTESSWIYAEDFSLVWKANNRDTHLLDEEATQKLRKKQPLQLQIGVQFLGLEKPIDILTILVPYQQDRVNDSIGLSFASLSPNEQFLGFIATQYGAEESSPQYTLRILSIADFVSRIYFQAGKQFLKQKQKAQASDCFHKAFYVTKSKALKKEIATLVQKNKF